MLRIFALSLMLSGLVVGAEPAQPKVKSTSNITYSTVDGVKLQLDLVVPDSPGPHPCVICFHGGAWKGGSRRDLPTTGFASAKSSTKLGMLEAFAMKGYAAASVTYRLAPKHQFPAQIQDAKTAVRFLRANAKKYNLDGERFAALGFSAGGHLAALLGTTDAKAGFDTKEHGEVTSKVQAVVDFFGPTDLSLYCETPGINDAFMLPLLGKECLKDRKLYDRASPTAYVTSDDAPVLILHGNADIIVPVLHSELFKKKLEGARVPVKMITLDGRGHGWSGDDVDDTARATIAFLDEHLRKGSKK